MFEMQDDIKLPEPQGQDKVQGEPEPDTKGVDIVAVGPKISESKGKLTSPAKLEKHRLAKFKRLAREKRVFIPAIALFILVCALAGWFAFHNPSPPPKQAVAVVKKKEAPKPPPPIVSPLTGAVVTAEQAARPITAIMIENSTDARPQSGLRDAGVVYEAIAEGGITRFLTLFQENRPSYIGPVRSVRPYYLDWAAPFDGGIAHVGGSFDALQQIRNPAEGMKDLDQFFNAGSFWRIPERYAPHNVYTSFDRLDQLNKSKGFTSSKFTSWPRKADAPSATPDPKSIDIGISGFFFNVHYQYDPSTNTYMRSEGGKPHVDVLTAQDNAPQQLHPKTVIVLIMPYSYGPADDGARSTYGTTGSGAAYVFQDGRLVIGTWAKADRKSQIAFNDSDNKPIPLNAGQTWITMLSDPGNLKYNP